MSKCTIFIKVNGESFSMQLENSDPSVLIDDSVVQALGENPNALNTLLNNLQIVGNSVNIDTVTLKQIQTEGALANCDMEYIRSLPQYSHIKFPDVNANILLLDNLIVGKVPIMGRTFDKNGQEIIVMQNTLSDMYKLRKYLIIKNAIQQGGVVDKNSKYYPHLLELYEKRKINKSIRKVEDIILSYMQDKQSFAGLTFSDNSSVIQFMEKLVRNLQDYSLPKDYSDPIITELNYRKQWLGDGQISVTYKDLYAILKQNFKNILSENQITNFKGFKEFIVKEDGSLQKYLSSTNNQGQFSNNNIEALCQFLINTPEFDYHYLKTTLDGVVLQTELRPIGDAYSVAYDTIACMPSEDYRGYTIYKYEQNEKSLYFTSRGSLLETSKTKPTSSLEEAKHKIDEKLKLQDLRSNSFIEFMFKDSYIEDGKKVFTDSFSEDIKSSTYIASKQIVSVIDIPIDPHTTIASQESYLLTGKHLDKGRSVPYNLEDFYSLIDTYNISNDQKGKIKKLLDTPQKAVAFIYKVNEQLGTESRGSGTKLYNIAKTISEAPLVYYYVESASKSGRGQYKYQVIRTTVNEVTESRNKPNYPVQQWLSAIATVINDEFGVQANLLTAQEIKDLKLPVNVDTDKAFVYNGEVYINTTIATSNDLLHEYTHLLLGIIKSNPEVRNNYEMLLQHVVSSKEGQAELDRVRELYPNISKMDAYEEVFCNLFSAYVRGTVNRNTSKIFEASEEEIKKNTSNIFNTTMEDVKDFYNKKMQDVFGRFKSQVAVLLSEGQVDFGSTKETRRITNWISKGVNSGKIIEQC